MKKVNESEQVSGVQWCRAVRAAGGTGIATLRGAGAKSAQMAITDAKRTSKRSALAVSLVMAVSLLFVPGASALFDGLEIMGGPPLAMC